MKRKLHLVSRRIAGIDCDRPEVTLWVRTRYADYARIRFIVDTTAGDVEHSPANGTA